MVCNASFSRTHESQNSNLPSRQVSEVKAQLSHRNSAATLPHPKATKLRQVSPSPVLNEHRISPKTASITKDNAAAGLAQRVVTSIRIKSMTASGVGFIPSASKESRKSPL